MRARLGDQIALCHKEITLARIRAVAADSPQVRREYQKLAKHWRELAATLAFAEQVSGFIEWRARRVDPPS